MNEGKLIFNMYCIRDKKSDFAAPVPIMDNEQAKRWFDNQIKTNPFMAEYKNDFELYHVGQFCTETGTLIGITTPEFIMAGEEVKTNGNK